MEAGLVEVALTMKEAVLCFNMIVEKVLRKNSAACSCTLTLLQHCTSPAIIDTSLRRNTLHYIGYFFVQELVEEAKIAIHYVSTQDQLADLGTRYLCRHRYRALIKLMDDFET